MGNHGLNNGGNGYSGRGRWQNGGASYSGAYGTSGADNLSGGFGGAGAFNAAAYNAAPYNAADVTTTFPGGAATISVDGITTFPGGVTPLPRWREAGTTPLPTTFRTSVESAGAANAAVSDQLPSPTVPIAPVTIPSNGGPAAGSGTNGTLTLGFEPVRAAPDQVGQTIALRLTKLPSIHFLGGVRVDIVGRTAYLRGRVASEHERDLAERVVLLEAGIDDVVNLMEVGGGPGRAVPPPPAPAAPAANG
jgi:hypothetical protein